MAVAAYLHDSTLDKDVYLRAAYKTDISQSKTDISQSETDISQLETDISQPEADMMVAVCAWGRTRAP